METLDKEQPQNVQPSQEENTEGSLTCDAQENGQAVEAERGVPVGKFKSVDDLLCAYNNLEAEFTRKSQRLAILEKEKQQALSNDSPMQDVEAKAFLEKFKETAKPDVQNIILQDDEIKNRIIQNYMKALTENKSPIVISQSSGERVTRPVTPKPDTFEAAKKVVLDLLS